MPRNEREIKEQLNILSGESGLEGTIFDPPDRVVLDKNIGIEVHRRNIRQAEIIWTDLPWAYFPTDSTEAYLEISDSPTEGFKCIETIKRGHPPYFLDTEYIGAFYRTPVVYYRIYLPEVKKVSRAFPSEKRPNFYGAEMERRHAIQLKEGHAGNLMYLFIRRRLAERCPDCWDKLREQRSKTNCPTCLNTGYIGGYYDPIGIYVSLSQEHAAVVQPIDSTAVAGNMQGWTAGFPRINLGDLLVDPATRDIWHVAQVGMTTHKRTVTKQELVLQRQDEDLHIFRLLDKVPYRPERGDMRHGEIHF